MSDDPKVSQRYRELPREEPPRSLDDAILAASRRAVHRRRRWYGPLAAAAVITLAVGVTLHVQHDRPSEEVDAVSPSMKVQEVPPPEAPKAEPPKAERRAPQPFASSPRSDSASGAAAAAPAPQMEQAPAPAAPPVAQSEAKDVGALSGGVRAQRDEQRSRAQMARSSITQTPEMELERIARLRTAGKHEEADKALAEFRKRYPDYRFSDEMKAKVEKRQ